ncbi:MAG: T9SS type A sorting domain-containing protein, partial [Bacteroidales bacterium]|nr:T9SS type A sorting domain-containing protein [Bacteroidales bacterium]
ITDQDVIESVSLELIDYLLTFIVKAQDGSALEGASVSVNFESLVTDENGVASLEVIPGSYEYIVTMADYLGVTSTVEVVDQDVTVEISLQPNGINEDIFSNFKLYPNPFSEKITLNNPWLVERVLINTMDGKLVYDILLNGNSEIKTSDLKNGIYLITLEGWNGERFMVKMVK